MPLRKPRTLRGSSAPGAPAPEPQAGSPSAPFLFSPPLVEGAPQQDASATTPPSGIAADRSHSGAAGDSGGNSSDPSFDHSSLNSSFLSRWGTNSPNLPERGAEVTTLLGGLTLAEDLGDTAGIPTRPQRLWKVSDVKVPPFPSFFYPKPVTYVSIPFTSPSVIAIRISEALTKRSIAAEYDDEAATANCLTVDRVHFLVHLWQSRSSSSSSHSSSVLVECVRISGNTISFHQAAHAILQAAQSLDSGADRRSVYQSSPTEYPRLGNSAKNVPPSLPPASKTPAAQEAEPAAVEALEQAYQLLCKDRLDARLCGMEMLVNTTDVACVGAAVAQHAALALLGAPTATVSGDSAAAATSSSSVLLKQIHTDWILRLLLGRANEEVAVVTSMASDDAVFRCSTSLLGRADGDEPGDRETQAVEAAQDGDEQLSSQMRALALRAFVNSLSVLSFHQPSTLQLVLSLYSPINASKPVLHALFNDLNGASRPVSAASRFGSPHEAALAAKALGLIARHSTSAKEIMLNDQVLLEQLEKVAAIGRSTHAVLAAEARQTYQWLSEEDRSC